MEQDETMDAVVTRPRAQRVAKGKPAARRITRDEVIAEARRLGASIVGFAPVARWAEHGEIPPAYHPEALWPQARTVIAFGVPMLLPVIETTPSINYQEHYDTSNRLLDEISFRLAVWLNEAGHPAMSLPRDGYGSLEILLANPFASFSHTYAAKYAGLGTVGMSRNLLVPQYGPRVRLNSVFTATEFDGDPELAEELCTKCRICERTCPTGAIRARDDGILGDLDKDACTRHHIALRDEKRWPCGICVKVCSIGEDRHLYGNRSMKRYLDERPALEKNPDDLRYRPLVHVRRHGSGGSRIA
ncbi:4Fe-4S binding protein [Rhodovastum atsumiense]|nr:4Fe-4S binding protein [Rhodovastum atsumiense]